MGNLIFYQQKSNGDLWSKADPYFNFMRDWTRAELSKLYRNYIRYYFGKGFYCTKSEIKRIAFKTKLQEYEDLLFTYYAKKSSNKVNIMEIFAGIIVFADMNWTKKISAAFKLFDFDGNNSISDDELFIMCKSFIESFSLMTNGNPCSNSIIKELISTSKYESMTCEELIEWAKQKPFIYFTLNPFAPNVPVETYSLFINTEEPRQQKFLNKTFDKRRDNQPKHRRTKSSLTKQKEKNLSVVVDGDPVTKLMVSKLKVVFDSVGKQKTALGRDLIREMGRNGIKDVGIVSPDGFYTSFKEFLEAAVFRADSGQVARMLAMVNVMTPLPERTIKGKAEVVNKKIQKAFKKYDTNGDGVIDYKELKTALEPNFTDTTINELFINHCRKDSGMSIQEFTNMFS